MNFVLHILILTSLIMHVKCLSCAPKEDVNCTEKSIVESRCPYGIAKDVCDNCWICAKGFGEKCGGIWNLGGTCAVGLYCSNPPEKANSGGSQTPGICCRTVAPAQTAKIAYNCKAPVINKCSLELECPKRPGENCGGPGGIQGICAGSLLCFPISDNTRDRNSTCIYKA